MSWITPKTDWVATDRFNISDYNRIRGNISYLHEEAVKIFGPFDIEDMGEDIASYSVMWDYRMFNAIENNIDILNENMLKEKVAKKATRTRRSSKAKKEAADATVVAEEKAAEAENA